MQAADWIALSSEVVAVSSLYVAIYSVRKGNRNSSVATMVMISEASREAWKRFLSAQNEETRSYELAELMNLLEIACAILNEKSFAGVSKKLLNDYLNEVVSLLCNDVGASKAIEGLFSSPTTFEHIRKFYNARRSEPLSITTPKQWFQL